MIDKLGILLTNVGSPEALTIPAVQSFLKKFLSDKRVVTLPRVLWWPILHGIILRKRPKHSLELYQKIWCNEGSPLTIGTRQLAKQLQTELNIPVVAGMHYSNPSIETALAHLQQQKITKLIVLPLFPQFSTTTTSVTFDQVAAASEKLNYTPNIMYVNNYHDHPSYIHAIAHSIQHYPYHYLLFSFHGIPERHKINGDVYSEHCHTTARLIAEKLNLSPHQWSVSFQSRLGYARWLTPYTSEVLTQLPAKGISNVHVVCPGFAIDCLETLEEIAIRGKEQFLEAGGQTFQYIEALNASSHQMDLMKSLKETFAIS